MEYQASTEMENQADYDQYRVLSVLAVASLILGILSFTSLLFVKLVALPILGLILGFRAISVIRRRPNELTGIHLAIAGVALSGLMFVGSVAWATYDYLTEVPPGYQRISWLQLQPVKDHPELPVSPESLKMNGEKIFVKGYIYPDETTGELTRFVLVPDMGTCCFGGQPKLTDMIEVHLQGDLSVRYSYRKQRLGGKFKVDTRQKPVSGLGGVYYQLEADYIK